MTKQKFETELTFFLERKITKYEFIGAFSSKSECYYNKKASIVVNKFIDGEINEPLFIDMCWEIFNEK